jgi:hypothetical protein
MTLFEVYLGQRKVETLFLLWLIGFLRWRISLYAISDTIQARSNISDFDVKYATI